MGWFLRLSCLVIVAFGFYVMWEYVTVYGLWHGRPPAPVHHAPQSLPAVYHEPPSVPPLPVDHVAQRRAI